MEVVPLRQISLKFSRAQALKEGNCSSREAFIKEPGVESEVEKGTEQSVGWAAGSPTAERGLRVLCSQAKGHPFPR